MKCPGILKTQHLKIPTTSPTHHRLVALQISRIVRLIAVGGAAVIGLLVGALRALALGERGALRGRVDVRRILEDESVQLVLDGDDAMVAARLARLRDDLLLGGDEQVRLGVVALGAQDVLADEAVEQVLQLGRVVRAVDDEALVLVVELGLSAELAAEELGGVRGWAVEGLGHVGHVDDDRLDAVALALDLGADARHLVPVVKVGDLAVNIQSAHGWRIA